MSSSDKQTPCNKSTRFDFLKLFAPQVPGLLVKSAGHFLSLTPQSEYWDLRTTLTVEFLRLCLGQSKRGITVEDAQALSFRQPKIQANTWKVDVKVPVVEEDAKRLEEIVRRAVVDLGSAGIEQHIPRVGVQDSTGEWIGAGAGTKLQSEKEEYEEREGWSEEEKYRAMVGELETGEDGVVVLMLHGGAYWLCDPATHRPLARSIAKHMKGRVFLPRYRLAPQNPFPAALLDALVAYLYLLYPPKGALHQPIPASRIAFSGDSAGGGLALSLLQLLLHLHRYSEGEDGYENMPSSTPLNSPKLHWQGESRRLPLPGGVAVLSPWVDVSRCLGERFLLPGGGMGSEDDCGGWDYLPNARVERDTDYKPSPAWPGDVKRCHMYAPDALITHPLVSPIAAESWKGSPPVWMSVGDECLRDSNLYFAHRLLLSDVNLQLCRYTAMPHVFQGTIPHLPVARKSHDSMAEFLYAAFGRSEKQIKLGEFTMHPVSLEETVHDREELKLGGLEFEELLERMNKEVKYWAQKEVVEEQRKEVAVAKL